MEQPIPAVLLVLALVAPVVLFWRLMSQGRSNGKLAAAFSVLLGWVLNVAWAVASSRGSGSNTLEANGDTLAIALRYGWACPAVLVLLTGLAWRYARRRRN